MSILAWCFGIIFTALSLSLSCDSWCYVVWGKNVNKNDWNATF